MLNDLFGAGSSDETKTEPWGPTRAPLLKHMGLIGDADPWEMYGGQEIAGLNADQLAAMQQARDWYGGQGQQLQQQLANQGRGMLGAYDQAQDIYGRVGNAGPIVNEGADLAMAAEYANNPYLDEMIGAVNRDVSRGLYEDQMPGIAAYAAGNNMLGSSRRGMAEGIAQRGAADRMADTSATLRGASWGQGLQAAQAIAAQNANLAVAQQQQQLAAAQGLGGLGQAGGNLMNAAQDMQGVNSAGLLGVGNMLQQQKQSELQNARNNFYMGQQMPYQQATMGINALAPLASGFGTTTGAGMAGASTAQGLMGLGLGAASIFGMQ